MHPIDWNATAAWIALVISVAGTISSPIITAIITNRHQLRLRKLDIKQAAVDRFEQNRFTAINTFISKAGRCLAYADENSVMDLGEAYHCIYQYVPVDFWDELDEFFSTLVSYKWDVAKKLYPPIVRRLSGILTESPRVNP